MKFCKPCLHWQGGIKYELKQSAPGRLCCRPLEQPFRPALRVSSGLKPQWLRGCGPGCSGFGGPQCCLSLAFLVQPLTSRTCCRRASDVPTLVALVTLRACAPFCPRATVLPRETLSPSRPRQDPRAADARGSPAATLTPRHSGACPLHTLGHDRGGCVHS